MRWCVGEKANYLVLAEVDHLGHLYRRIVLLGVREQTARADKDAFEAVIRQGDVLLLHLFPCEVGRRLEGILRPEESLLLLLGEERRCEVGGVRYYAADEMKFGLLEFFTVGAPGDIATVCIGAGRVLSQGHGTHDAHLPAFLDEALLHEELEHLMPHFERDARGAKEVVGGEVSIFVGDHHVAGHRARDIVPDVFESRLVSLRVATDGSLDAFVADLELVLEPQTD